MDTELTNVSLYGFLSHIHHMMFVSCTILVYENGQHFVMSVTVSLQNDVSGKSAEVPY